MKKIKVLLLSLLFGFGLFAPLCAETAKQEVDLEQFDMAANVLLGGGIDPEIMMQWSAQERGVMRHVLLAKRDGIQKESLSEDRIVWLTRAQKITGGVVLATGFATAVLLAMTARYHNAYTMATLFSELGSKEFAKECSSIATKATAQTWKWFGGTVLSCTALFGSAFYAAKVTQELEQAQAAGVIEQRVDEFVEFIDKVDQNS